jgi:hypothetical protein
MPKLLSIDSNSKTIKGQSYGWMTGILYLSPASLSGKNLCPHSSAGCRAACLYSAGRGVFKTIQEARMKKTRLFLEAQEAFLAQIGKDIKGLIKKAEKSGMRPCVRLNGTSDLPWHKLGGLMQEFSGIQFYDYTPNLGRMLEFLDGKLPANYHLTFSKKEDNGEAVDQVIMKGGNVAVVFKQIPTEWKGRKVVDGDLSDLRFLDGEGVIVGLKAKGKAKKDTSGFVV